MRPTAPLLLALLSACGEEPCPEGSSRQADGLCHLDDDDTGGEGGSGSDSGTGFGDSGGETGEDSGGDDTGGSSSGGDDTGEAETGGCPETPFDGDATDLAYEDYPVYIAGGPRRFTSIQNGIWGAEEGDTVVACPGVYYEVVDFKGKIITVRSEAGPAKTTIDAQDQGPAVRLRNYEPGETVLEGFHITGGAGEEFHGGGIFVEYGSPTIRYNIIEGNTTRIGAGVYVRNGGANVHNNIIYGNYADEGGGGIVCTACVGSIRYNTFYANQAAQFGPFSEYFWGIADLVGNIVVQKEDEEMTALYYREHRQDGFATGPNLLWPAGEVVTGMAVADWPEGDWVQADPLFEDAGALDFRLRADSPAVDAGPEGELDADGSPADLGAFGGPEGEWPWDPYAE